MPEGVRTTVVARRRRMSAAQVRSAMIEAGQRSVLNAGLTLDLNDSHFDDLIRNAAVPRSSVFRIWQSKADYLVDLYEALGADGIGQAKDGHAQAAIFEVAKEILKANGSRLKKAAGRREVLLELVRQGVSANVGKMSEFSQWQSYLQMLISAPILTDLPEGTRISDALVETERVGVVGQAASRYAEIFGGSLGLRLKRSEFSYEQFVVAANGVVEGFAVRSVLASAGSKGADVTDPSLRAVTEATIPGPAIDGGTAPWLPAAIAFLGIVDTFFEPIEA